MRLISGMIPCFGVVNCLERMLLQCVSSPLGKGSQKEENPLLGGRFSHRKGHR
jgi:hypothetical protein